MDKARILIADDDLTARLLMRAALEQNDFEVTEAADGDQALESAESAPPDLVLLDVEMPGQDGFSVCQALRRRRGGELPIIMVTGMDDMTSIERAYQSGATDFIAKPINWTLIGHRVRYVLRAYRNLLALHDAQSHNLAMLRAIPDMLFRVDRSGRVLDVHGANRMLGGTGELPQTGRSVADCLPEPVALRLMELARQAANTGEIQIHDYTLPDQAGVDRHYESRITQCGDAGEVLCLVRWIGPTSPIASSACGPARR
ncbi:MAG: response regulator [Thiobacillaceae bacterium]|nr:response regulator [Thiobacillaceae bacterium]